MAMNANVRSRIWYEEESDMRGRRLEIMLVTNELCVLNKDMNLTTFEDSMYRER